MKTVKITTSLAERMISKHASSRIISPDDAEADKLIDSLKTSNRFDYTKLLFKSKNIKEVWLNKERRRSLSTGLVPVIMAELAHLNGLPKDEIVAQYNAGIVITDGLRPDEFISALRFDVVPEESNSERKLHLIALINRPVFRPNRVNNVQREIELMEIELLSDPMVIEATARIIRRLHYYTINDGALRSRYSGRGVHKTTNVAVVDDVIDEKELTRRIKTALLNGCSITVSGKLMEVLDNDDGQMATRTFYSLRRIKPDNPEK